jgi:hypothetical protein
VYEDIPDFAHPRTSGEKQVGAPYEELEMQRRELPSLPSIYEKLHEVSKLSAVSLRGSRYYHTSLPLSHIHLLSQRQRS